MLALPLLARLVLASLSVAATISVRADALAGQEVPGPGASSAARSAEAQSPLRAGADPHPDSVYATPFLRRLVALAAERNRQAPAGFGSYRARVETELALIARDSLGREHALEIEQLETRATWHRNGAYDLRMLGYRAQNRGVPYSMLTGLRGYTVPWLYGERLDLGIVPAEKRLRRKSSRPARDTLTFVHPFAADRERYYRFEGGDTLGVIGMDGRRIPIVRVTTRPVADHAPMKKFGAFDGQIDVDAERGQIVRMRGQFVSESQGSRGGAALVHVPGVVAVAYVDFTNAEVARRYWLPASQRTEFQATMAPLGATRAIFRLVSTFSAYELSDTTAVADTSIAPTARTTLTYAPRDSMDHFAGWRDGLGDATAAVQAEDFADLAPDSWRADGPPRADLLPRNLLEVFRFNRVEGLYLGASGTVRFRDAFPGLSAGAFGGYALAERTFRGGARATLQRMPWILSANAERALPSTNDFVLPLSDDPGLTALLGSVDDYDYVDRRRASLALTRVLGSVETAVLTVEGGAGRDRGEQQRINRGLLGAHDARFRPNRGAIDGSYGRVVAELDLRPSVSGDFLQPGVGARLHVEAAAGELAWRRAELALSARKYFGPLSLAAHADAGLVAGSVLPPQQMFELGGHESIPGYAFKEFAGDRAALFRTSASYRLGLLARPVHAIGALFLPAPAPRLAVSAQGGWTELSSASAILAAERLGAPLGTPIPGATNGVRASVAVGATFFSDLVHVAVARPIDHVAAWKLVAGLGPVF